MAQQTITEKCYAYINGSWVELLDVAPISVSRGLSDNNPETRLADIGSISLKLDNSSGIYTPGTTAGWKKGIPFKFVITYDSKTYIAFRGAIDTIELESKPGEKLVQITALDWLDYASKYPIVNPDLLEEVRADYAINNIVSSMPIQPQAISLDVGDVVYPTIFDTVRENTKAYSEFAKLANSETGYIYLHAKPDSGEELVFESLDHRNGTREQSQFPVLDSAANVRVTSTGDVRLTSTGDTRITNDNQAALYDNVDLAVNVEYGQNIINRFTSNAYPKRNDTAPAKIYASERPIYLSSGQSKTFRIFWKDPIGKRPINARPPNATSNVKSLCHFDTQNGEYFIDETGKAWYANDAPLVTNVVKYGNGSSYLDGTNSYLYSPDSPDWDFGTGDFCVEWFEYRFASTSGRAAISRTGESLSPFTLGYSNGTNLVIYMSSGGGTNDISNAQDLGVITLDTWNHFAVSRSGSTFRGFKNGILTTTFTSALALYATNTPLYIGYYASTYLNACIDDVRITKGEPVYTKAFAAPSAPLSIYGTFYSIWTGLNSTGTEITSDLITSADYGTEGAVISVQNNSALGGYLNVNVFGYGIYSDSALADTQENTDSIDSFGHQNETLQQAYQQDTAIGTLEGKRVIELYNQPRTILNSVSLCANSSSYNMLSFLNLDIGDLIRIKVDKHNIDAMYYIQGIDYSLNGGIIMFTWNVKEAFTLELGLSPLAVEFAGGAATDAIDYGYLPIVSADEITKRVFSAWIYLDAISATDTQVILSTLSSNSGTYLYVSPDAANVVLSFSSAGFSASGGTWNCPDDAFAVGGWVHVLVSYDRSAATNDPAIYIGGVIQTLTEAVTPSGTVVSEEGNGLTAGNYKTTTQDYNGCFNGKIKDARFYDMNKTSLSPQAIATGITAEGAYGSGFYEGMVFDGFVCRTADLTAYTDLTLTDEKVIEAYNGYIGTANGSPITRTP